MRRPHFLELSEFDAVARDSANLSAGRIAAATLAIFLVGATLGWPTTAVWAPAQIGCEIL